MKATSTGPPAARRPLRLWPGVGALAVQWIGGYALPAVVEDAAMIGLACVALGVLGIIAWWLFFSRAAWIERLGALALMAVGLAATPLFLHESVRGAGMGVAFYILAVPVLCLALVLWALGTRRLPDRFRRTGLVAAILLACAGWALVRTDGITGDGSQLWAWRWSETAEERLLARGEDDLPVPVTPTEPIADWPGFRGAERDSVARGARVGTDWIASPPVELWRRPIGPGWSSFAVQGGRLYTHEQRGEQEVVSCYDAATGGPVWRHRDPVRFWESHAGAGPRATPALAGGRLYTFGGTGILNALDAADGSLAWSRDAAADTGKEVPHWGFTSSPLVVGELVIVDTGALVAYDRATGELRWTGPESDVSYSSPQLMTLGGVPQVLLLSGRGAVSVDPADGATLWQHDWPGASIVQPNRTADGDLLISATGAASGVGMRRLAVAATPAGWTVSERWESRRLKPYFSDFVVHHGHAYGFDGRILASIDLADGGRNWKGGRYGHGQLLLLPEQDLLLVVSEKGELALVSATAEPFTELARVPALHGKSWAHPVLVDDLLVLRNAEEMAAYRLPSAGS